ncbi:MAG TPA: hypothetical protein VGL99_20540, partial [Chloroflexota bacterium]
MAATEDRRRGGFLTATGADLLTVDTEPNRARGGVSAIAGFDFQMRVSIAEFVEKMVQGNLESARNVMFEAFSDVMIAD